MDGFDERNSQSSDEMAPVPDFGDNVDIATFSQILEMDDDEDDRDFSGALVGGFFEQASETYNKMEESLKAKNLEELSALGHFLKGSSATLGFNKIRDSCNVIQQYGHGLTVDGTEEPDEDVCFNKITEALSKVKADSDELEKQMKRFFKWT